MSKLKLKDEFKGKTIVKSIPRMGEMTFNTEKVKEHEYENYKRLGFEECFEDSNEEINKRIEKLNSQAAEVEKPVEENDEEEFNLDLDEKIEEVEAPKVEEVEKQVKKRATRAKK
jgi:hypothetical protein